MTGKSKQIVLCGWNINILSGFPDNYFDSIVTDAPYGLGRQPDAVKMLQAWIDHGYLEVTGKGFMGKKWDAFVPQPIFWKEAMRVLKPGGHVLCFFGTRTYDWGVMAMRLAGFEIRDCIQWLYGSGFPKSLNISKAIDKAAGAERPVVGHMTTNTGMQGGNFANKSGSGIVDITSSATAEAIEWNGWGTALKPAHEDLVLALKPFNAVPFTEYFVSLIGTLIKHLCQYQLFAKIVEEHSLLSLKELSAGLNIALWNVEKFTNTQVDLNALMGILQLEIQKGYTNWSTVLKWLKNLADLLCQMNTSITQMELSMTTEMKILSSLEWESIFQNIILVKNNQTNGLNANVWNAESLFNVLQMKLKDIQELSAHENAILKESKKDLLPKCEPIVLARKPLIGTVVENVLKYGTGGINIDGSRISHNEEIKTANRKQRSAGWNMDNTGFDSTKNITASANEKGRFPANIIFDEAAALSLDQQTGNLTKPTVATRYLTPATRYLTPKNQGGASRFFYCPKVSQSERNEGVENFQREAGHSRSDKCANCGGYVLQGPDRDSMCSCEAPVRQNEVYTGNTHPTVKPVDLMRYLVKLITPLGGICCDPFAGSGSTGISCKMEDLNCICIEQDEIDCKVAEQRISAWKVEMPETQIELFS